MFLLSLSLTCSVSRYETSIYLEILPLSSWHLPAMSFVPYPLFQPINLRVDAHSSISNHNSQGSLSRRIQWHPHCHCVDSFFDCTHSWSKDGSEWWCGLLRFFFLLPRVLLHNLSTNFVIPMVLIYHEIRTDMVIPSVHTRLHKSPVTLSVSIYIHRTVSFLHNLKHHDTVATSGSNPVPELSCHRTSRYSKKAENEKQPRNFKPNSRTSASNWTVDG